MKRAAVLGGSGMLGAALVAALVRRGVEVVHVGRRAGDDVPFDLLAPEVGDAAAAHPVDVFFHCAASFAGDDDAGTRRNFRVNAESALAIVALLATMQCRHLVHAGTVSSYATGAELSSYGLSKSHAEDRFSWWFGRHDGWFCSLRFCQLYDTEGRCCAHQPWFGRIVAYAARGLALRLPPGAEPRSFLHVEDAAALMVAAAEARVSGVWPACHPGSQSYASIAQLTRSVFAQRGAIVVDESKRPFRAAPVRDSAEFFRRVGVDSLVSLREGLERIRDHEMAGRFGPMDVL
jgi:nucleoside-diphosphate-sugar epimerase